jgi:hypothetical protein
MHPRNKIMFFLPWYSETWVKGVVNNNPNILFLGRQNVWSIDGQILEMRPAMNDGLMRHFDYVLNQIKLATPIFSRNYDFMPFQETIIRESVFSVLALADQLKKRKISLIYIGHSGSHHLDTLILELAARIQNIPQLYETHLINGLGVAVLKRDSFKKANLVHIMNSSDYKFSLTQEFNNGWNVPLSYGPKQPIKLFWLAVLIITMRSVLNNAKHLVKMGFQKPFIKIKYFRRFNFFTIYRILNRQKLALSTLQLFVEEDKYLIQQLMESKKINKKTPLVVIYAHHQPEVSSYPLGEKFHNYIDIVIALRNSGFKDTIIYREHPVTFHYSMKYEKNSLSGIERSPEYYELLRNLNCLFVDTKVDLPEEEIVPLTITGNIALQRASRGFNTIVVGQPWYKDIPNLIRDFSELQLLNSTFENRIDLGACQRYISYVEKHNIYVLPSRMQQGMQGEEKLKSSFSKLLDSLLNLNLD